MVKGGRGINKKWRKGVKRIKAGFTVAESRIKLQTCQGKGV